MIRRLITSDAERLQRLWMDTFSQAHPSLPLCYWRARLPDLHRCWGEETVLVYCSGGTDRADGMIATSKGGELTCLFVARALQGTGAGSDLLSGVLGTQPWLSVCVLEENLGARYFFQRHGFREHERRYCPVARQDQLLMHRAGRRSNLRKRA